MHNLGEVLIPIVLFALVFGLFYIFIAARNKERMALIEKGAEASIFNKGKSLSTGKWLLQTGIFVIGVSLGILVGNMLDSVGMKEPISYTSGIFFFGGVGLVVAYLIGRKLNGDKN